MADNKIDLKIVVNGTEVVVEANVHAPLQTVIEPALQKSGNAGQPPSNWVLRDANGNELDVTKKIGDFGFNAQTILYLSLKAGIGGN